jgi:hypothetical protein
MFILLTLIPLNRKIETQFNGQQGRDPKRWSSTKKGTETKRRTPKVQVWNLAKPGETLRQKDPAPTKLWKIPQGIPTVKG